ncbi:MAG TPA: phospholipase D-like domain-containing protein [Kofleriaceae bacterium]|nr:phospholipase D-like domain-containing protein [Kofleriaceae bacterium]
MDTEVEDGEHDAFPDGKADGGIEEGSPEAIGVLALVNDPASTASALKSGAGITSRVATNIVKHRDGADGVAGTADDDKFDTLAELDAIPYVGPVTLNALLTHARDRGLVATGARIDVIFSPQAAADSHNARIAQLIRGAQKTVDIAMYSYSDAGITAALTDAVQRGVKVRFLFETARDDKGLTDPTARAASKSGRLEAIGVDVRYVNKILHHKFTIVDGPRDDASLAATAKVVTGSANWSSTGGTVFDENTMFIENSEEIAALYQNEFDALWVGSRDFVGPATIQSASTASIKPADVRDEPGLEALFTRANFTVGGSDGATWSANKDSLVVANQFVAAIQRAEKSIHIGSGHMRLRPVAEALIAKKQANPTIDIKVYLDQQEWISVSGDAEQRKQVEDCKARATTSTALRDCSYNDFLFSKALVDAGIDVRFKVYAYRWDATYAVQMHSKYMIIDGKELLSGSYNLSMNSEHGTFENAMHLSGPQFLPVVGKFEDNFAKMWETGRANDLLGALRTQITTATTFPIVFDSMALTWSEFDQLRVLFRANCSLIDSTDFRSNPGAHRTCTR